MEWAELLHGALYQGPRWPVTLGLPSHWGPEVWGHPSNARQDVSVGLGGLQDESSLRLVVWEGFLEEGSSELGQEGRTGGVASRNWGCGRQGLAQAALWPRSG